MIGMDQIDRLKGAHVVDGDGHRIGTVDDAYFTEDGPPSWITVRTGVLDTRIIFVPLDEAELEGHVLRIPYSKETVKQAPRLNHVPTVDQQLDLHRYYDLSRPLEHPLRKHEVNGGSSSAE